MEFRQLESYVAVVEHRSFTAAAEKLYISQPTVSTHIHMLEEELHSCLIIRTTKSIEVTPKGMEVYEYARDLLDMRTRLVQSCLADTKKIIHIGASTIPSAYILPEVLPQFSNQSPNTFFVIHQSNSQGVMDSVANGVYDIGLIGVAADSDNLICEAFCEDQMVLITPVTESFLQLQSAAETPLDALLQEPIILREKGSGSQKRADLFLTQMGVDEDTLTVSARVNDPEAIKNLVAGGLGISIISERAAQNFLREKRLLKFDLTSTGSRNLYMVYRKSQDLQPHIKDFVTFVRNFYH